jgi:hypothetical protein
MCVFVVCTGIQEIGEVTDRVGMGALRLCFRGSAFGSSRSSSYCLRSRRPVLEGAEQRVGAVYGSPAV